MNTPAPTPSFRARRSRPAAFTLIELLTVIAIIGILAAILIPTVSKVRQTAQRAVCMSNMRQFGVALLAYVSDNKAGGLPGYYRITDKSGAGHTVTGASGAAGPLYYADNGIPTRSVQGQLSPYLTNAVKGSGNKSGKISLMVCPSNPATAETINNTDPAPSYAVGVKVRSIKDPTKLVRPFSNEWNTPSLRYSEISSPRTAVALFDTDQEFVALVGTSAIATAAPSAAHVTTRNVLFFDGHVASVDSKIDPYEKL